MSIYKVNGDYSEKFKDFVDGQDTNAGTLEAHLSDYTHHGELIAFPGYYIEVQFDEPTEGDITETMKKSEDNSVFLTKVTEFDEPTEGDITTTVECVELGIHNKVVTEFDEPTEGDITNTASEVV